MVMLGTKRGIQPDTALSLAIFLSLLLPISSAWPADHPISNGERRSSLNHLLETPESLDVRNVFLGLALYQGGKRLKGSPAVVENGDPLQVEIQWERNTGNPIEPAVEVQFLSHNNRYVRLLESELTLAASGENRPRPGASFRQRGVVDLEPVLGRYSGRGFLIFHRPLPGPEITHREALQYVPVYIEPVPRGRTVSTDEYGRFFSENHVSLDMSVRLGYGSEAVLFLEKPLEEHGKLGVLSSFGYGSEQQGGVVAEMKFLRDGEVIDSTALRSGLHTARADYDFNPGAENHEKITIIESREADYLSARGTPFMRHKYVTVLDLESGAGAADSIRVRSKSPVILELHDLILTD